MARANLTIIAEIVTIPGLVVVTPMWYIILNENGEYMKQTKTQTKLESLRRQFDALRQQTGSLNEVERLNLVRVRVGLKPVRSH